MTRKSELTIERLRFVLDYDPVTGAMTWKNPNSSNVSEGDRAGSLSANGRRYIRIDGETHLAHRLAWFHHYGQWPGTAFLSPKNNDYDDIRIDNLEVLTPSENAKKGGPLRTNTSGVRGVTWAKDKKLWLAYLTHNYKRIHVGYFKTIEEARTARDARVAELGLEPIQDADEVAERAAAITRDGRLRVTWRKLLRQTYNVTDWRDFAAFSADIGDVPRGRMVLVPIDPEKTIGPGNWQWVKAAKWDYSTYEGKKAYATAHREMNRNSYRDRALRKTFDITLADYQQMLAAQNNVCAICKRPEKDRRKGSDEARWLCVDHCHATGSIRGLLCGSCNRGIGKFEDNIEFLRSAVSYLERYEPETSVPASRRITIYSEEGAQARDSNKFS